MAEIRSLRRHVWDVLGVVLLAAWLLWVVSLAGVDTAAVGLTVAGAAGYVAGRLLGSQPIAVVALLLAGVVAAITTTGGLAGPGAGHLGYANATAALAVSGVTFAGMAAVSSRGRFRIVAALLAAVLTAVIVIVGSKAAVGGAVLVIVAAVVTVRRPTSPTLSSRQVAAGAVALLGALTAATVLIGVRYGASRVEPAWLRLLSQKRAELWHDALDLASAAPLTGWGPDSFARMAPSGADPDTSVAHSLVLGTAVEYGWVGAVLLAAVLCWAAVRTAIPHGCRFQLVALAGWAAFQAQSAIDYVASFPAVLMALGLVLGLAGAHAPADARRARRHPAPQPEET